jgi:hypothetical protein
MMTHKNNHSTKAHEHPPLQPKKQTEQTAEPETYDTNLLSLIATLSSAFPEKNSAEKNKRAPLIENPNLLILSYLPPETVLTYALITHNHWPKPIERPYTQNDRLGYLFQSLFNVNKLLQTHCPSYLYLLTQFVSRVPSQYFDTNLESIYQDILQQWETPFSSHDKQTPLAWRIDAYWSHKRMLTKFAAILTQPPLSDIIEKIENKHTLGIPNLSKPLFHELATYLKTKINYDFTTLDAFLRFPKQNLSDNSHLISYTEIRQHIMAAHPLIRKLLTLLLNAGDDLEKNKMSARHRLWYALKFQQAILQYPLLCDKNEHTKVLSTLKSVFEQHFNFPVNNNEQVKAIRQTCGLIQLPQQAFDAQFKHIKQTQKPAVPQFFSKDSMMHALCLCCCPILGIICCLSILFSLFFTLTDAASNLTIDLKKSILFTGLGEFGALAFMLCCVCLPAIIDRTMDFPQEKKKAKQKITQAVKFKLTAEQYNKGALLLKLKNSDVTVEINEANKKTNEEPSRPFVIRG